jgi:hypothetical protein
MLRSNTGRNLVRNTIKNHQSHYNKWYNNNNVVFSILPRRTHVDWYKTITTNTSYLQRRRPLITPSRFYQYDRCLQALQQLGVQSVGKNFKIATNNNSTITKSISTSTKTYTTQPQELIEKNAKYKSIFKSIRNVIASIIFGIPFIAVCQGVYLLSGTYIPSCMR